MEICHRPCEEERHPPLQSASSGSSRCQYAGYSSEDEEPTAEEGGSSDEGEGCSGFGFGSRAGGVSGPFPRLRHHRRPSLVVLESKGGSSMMGGGPCCSFMGLSPSSSSRGAAEVMALGLLRRAASEPGVFGCTLAGALAS